VRNGRERKLVAAMLVIWIDPSPPEEKDRKTATSSSSQEGRKAPGLSALEGITDRWLNRRRKRNWKKGREGKGGGS